MIACEKSYGDFMLANRHNINYYPDEETQVCL